ncbi:MAG: RNA polymerase sigma factor [Kofleriaceae bacterium]|nr:RNA polymerase sigma factor [Kofleriaceae bacterium]
MPAATASLAAAPSSPALQAAAEAACRAALRAGLGDADARDLAQEALVRALTTAQAPAGVPLTAWVYGIARNLGRDHHKAARRHADAHARLALAGEATPEADPAETLDVRQALDELPAPLREVVTLHELEQHSLRETAAALGIPVDTAKDRLKRARATLRDRLGDEAITRERSAQQRAAARWGAAVAAAAWLALDEPARAVAATALAGGGVSMGTAGAGAVATQGASASAGGVSIWLVAGAGAALLAGGFALGRFTAPTTTTTTTTTTTATATATATTTATATATATGPTTARVTSAVATPAPTPSGPTSLPPAATAPTDAAQAQSEVRAPVAAAPVPTVDASTPSSPPASTLDAERLIVDRARVAAQRGASADAVVDLMGHERRFPTGALAEERDVLLIDAYLRAGQPAQARARLATYRARHPAGALRARVDALAASLPPP